MKKQFLFFTALISSAVAFTQNKQGNPVIQGWYADPEAAIFNKQFWIYPTYSAKYEQQVFLDAFSSPDLVHWRPVRLSAHFGPLNRALDPPSQRLQPYRPGGVRQGDMT